MPETLANNAASTLNGAIDNVVTSLTVVNGAVFPASGNFRILIDSEILLCTARAANVLTVTRGQETTSAASHSNGAAVTHVLTKGGLDAYAVVQTLADAKGDILAATGADVITRLAVGANFTVLMADSTQATGLTWGGAWPTYVPVWTSTGTAPSLGNGTITGRYVQIGKTIHGEITLTMGSTTTFGTGVYFLSLPITAHASTIGPVGMASAIDASAGPAVFGGFFRIASTTTASIDTLAAPIGNWTNTAPMTWAVSDVAQVHFTYEAA